jgi:ATP-dependent DNA helicase RecG
MSSPKPSQELAADSGLERGAAQPGRDGTAGDRSADNSTTDAPNPPSGPAHQQTASQRIPSATERLATPVQFMKGVGPERAELLVRLGLQTARDVLFFFPRDYQDLTDFRSIAALEERTLSSVRGIVEDVDLRANQNGRSVLGVLLRDGGQYLRALWFNQPYMRDKFRPGQHVVLSGKPSMKVFRWEMPHPRVQWIDADDEPPAGKLLPIYPLTEGLKQPEVRRITQAALDVYLDALDEVLPEPYRIEHCLWPVTEALREIHFPSTRERLEQARRRFIYQELLVLQLALALRRHRQTAQARATPLDTTAKIDARVRRLFSFDFTAAQEQAIRDVTADLVRPVPMNRLLQGDVGSGKTVVAVYSVLVAVAHGHQAAVMAPTEVLARQHYQTLSKLLAESQVRTALLTGGLSAPDRQRTLEAIARGEVDLVIGTQAIISGGVKFARLALVVIDEQHKFGVRQRASLKQAGTDPHYLVMTATPIPRTIAMTVYGDLDVSTLTAGPPGRQNLYTYLAAEKDRPRWWEFVRRKLREGRQAYVIVPLVEESENWEAASIQSTYESLANGELEAFRLGLLHGRMPSGDKDAAMEAFHRGETQVLVSTSVIEVGIDVRNATVMTIFGANRFGLAQLHQLRGRVHRGSFAGYCCLFADRDDAAENERLQALLSTNDGFELAEKDFELRGPGELLGTRQHGLPPLRIADLRRDSPIVLEARGDAQKLMADDPELNMPEHALLQRQVLVRYGKALDLGDVG